MIVYHIPAGTQAWRTVRLTGWTKPFLPPPDVWSRGVSMDGVWHAFVTTRAVTYTEKDILTPTYHGQTDSSWQAFYLFQLPPGAHPYTHLAVSRSLVPLLEDWQDGTGLQGSGSPPPMGKFTIT